MNKKNFSQKGILLGADILLLAILIFIDQLTKHFAVLYLKDKTAVSIIDGVFELKYLENRGAAFGMLQNQKFFFIFIALVILAVIAYVLVKTPNQRKYVKLHIALVFVAGGALGNMIDRCRLDYVVDFLYFKLIDFPIFNVADIYVSVATVILVVLMLFYYKDEDMDRLLVKKEKKA